MLFGMITQVFCGCLTGLVNNFSLHIFFRYLSAVCCAQMYTAGIVICKINSMEIFIEYIFVENIQLFTISIVWFLSSSVVCANRTLYFPLLYYFFFCINNNSFYPEQLPITFALTFSFLVSDITGGLYRRSVICLFETFWGIGIILLPAVAHFFPRWTSIYMVISLPTLAYIILWKGIPDSPRWHLKRGRIDEAKDILLEGASINERNAFILPRLDLRLREQAAATLKEPAPLGWWSLWNNRENVIIMIALHIAWAVYVTNYNGMLLNIRAFGREYLEVNTVAAGGNLPKFITIGLNMV